MSYEIVNYQQKYLKYKKKYLDVTTLNNNNIMTGINKFAILDYATKYVMFGGDINDLISYGSQRGGNGTIDGFNKAYTEAIALYKTNITTKIAEYLKSSGLSGLKIGTATAKFAKHLAASSMARASHAANEALELAKETSIEFKDALTAALAYTRTKTREMLSAMYIYIGTIADEAYATIFAALFRETTGQKNCFYQSLKKGVIAAVNTAGTIEEYTKLAGEAARKYAIQARDSVSSTAASAVAILIKAPKNIEEAFSAALERLHKLPGDVLDSLRDGHILKNLTPANWPTIAAAGFKTIIAWLHATMNDPEKNPFTEHIICYNNIAEMKRVSLSRFKRVKNRAKLQVKIDSEEITPHDLTDEQIELLDASNDEYQRIDEKIDAFRQCLKTLLADISLFNYGMIATTTGAVIAGPAGLPAAAIAGAIYAISKIVGYCVQAVYIFVETIWTISSMDGEQEFETAKARLDKLITESPVNSLFNMSNIVTNLGAQLQRYVLVKIAMRRNLTSNIQLAEAALTEARRDLITHPNKHDKATMESLEAKYTLLQEALKKIRAQEEERKALKDKLEADQKLEDEENKNNPCYYFIKA